ncbi:MAG: hypothetical protein ACFBQW_00600 [Sphingomonadaceae bacterium]
MESDQRYYWRRASEELHAAAHAVTPAARTRRLELAESYFRKLKALAPREEDLTFGPVAEQELESLGKPVIDWSVIAGLRDRAAAEETRPLEWPLPRPEPNPAH